MATGKERIGRFLALNLVFAKHSDSHAASMVDCGIEGWMHELVWRCRGMPEWPLPFWLTASSLEQAAK